MAPERSERLAKNEKSTVGCAVRTDQQPQRVDLWCARRTLQRDSSHSSLHFYHPIMQKPVLRLLFLLLALGWAGLIYYLSAQPGTDIPLLFIHQDKILHFFAFGLLGFLAMGAIRAEGDTHRNWQIWLIVLLVGLYGVADEFHQRFVPGRNVSIHDVAADMAGGIMGAWAMYFLVKTLSARSSGFPLSRE